MYFAPKGADEGKGRPEEAGLSLALQIPAPHSSPVKFLKVQRLLINLQRRLQPWDHSHTQGIKWHCDERWAMNVVHFANRLFRKV